MELACESQLSNFLLRDEALALFGEISLGAFETADEACERPARRVPAVHVNRHLSYP